MCLDLRAVHALWGALGVPIPKLDMNILHGWHQGEIDWLLIASRCKLSRFHPPPWCTWLHEIK